MHRAIGKPTFKLIALAAVFGIFVVCFFSQGSSQTNTLRVTVAEQQNPPLLMFATFVDDSNPLKPRYGYSITNTTEKRVTAYAVRETVSFTLGPSIITTE